MTVRTFDVSETQLPIQHAGVDGTRDRANGPAKYVVDLDENSPLSGLWSVDRDRDARLLRVVGQRGRAAQERAR